MTCLCITCYVTPCNMSLYYMLCDSVKRCYKNAAQCSCCACRCCIMFLLPALLCQGLPDIVLAGTVQAGCNSISPFGQVAMVETSNFQGTAGLHHREDDILQRF